MAQGRFDSKCVWCNPQELKRRCEEQRLRKLLAFNIVELHGMAPEIAQLALQRVPASWRDAVQEDVATRVAEKWDEADAAAGARAAASQVVEDAGSDDGESDGIVGPDYEESEPECSSGEENAHRAAPSLKVSAVSKALSDAGSDSDWSTSDRGDDDDDDQDGDDGEACGQENQGIDKLQSQRGVGSASDGHMSTQRRKSGRVFVMKRPAHAEAKKKPAKSNRAALAPQPRKPFRRPPSHLCRGVFTGDPRPRRRVRSKTSNMAHTPCVFSTTKPGAPARKEKGSDTCMTCNPEALRRAAGTAHGRKNIMIALKAFARHNPVVLEEAKKRIAEAGITLPDLDEKIRQPVRRRRQLVHNDWKTLLAKRQSTMAPPSNDLKRKYREQVLDDQRYARKLVLGEAAPKRQRRARGAQLYEIPENSTGLPPAAHSSMSKGLEDHCRKGSWGWCVECGMLQPRPMRQIDLTRERKPEITKSQCKRCTTKGCYYLSIHVDVSPLSSYVYLFMFPPLCVSYCV